MPGTPPEASDPAPLIRPADLADVERTVPLRRAVNTDWLYTPRGVIHHARAIPAGARVGRWKAEVDGAIVAYAETGLEWVSSVEGDAFLILLVDPGHRGRGLGGALWKEVERHLMTIGARKCSGRSREDEISRAFARGRGFSQTASNTSSTVDPRNVETASSIPESVEIHTLGACASRLPELYEVDLEVGRDEPGEFDFQATTFEDWTTLIWEDPDIDHELSIVATVRGEIAGFTLLFADRATGQAANGFTAVRRPFRGRGLATLLKRASLTRAAEAGITRVLTQNDDTNAPMLAVNRKLGYQPFAESLSWKRDLTAPPSSA